MSAPIAVTEQGKLRGKVTQNIDGEDFYSFQGIPYAKPPLNELRFQAPQPPESWPGIRDATTEGHECFSNHMLFKHPIGSEDCLVLNVFTPQLPTQDVVNSLKPVMVWIHGGGFRSGSSKSELYGPEYLLTEDVVLVTINYRLGILGFLSFEDKSLGISDNAGLKDMVMALKWVQKNITNFCGDPNNVTIFGESAGGCAVHYLVLSPLAKGLFHKAISQSGCALNIGARGQYLSSELAAALKLPTINEAEILERLKALPIEKLFEVGEEVIEACDMLNNLNEKKPFAPVIEKPSEDAFIADDPLKIIKSGNYNNVPFVFGYTTREGMLIEMMMKPRKPEMPKNFEKLVPSLLGLKPESDLVKSIAEKIKQFYYGKPGSEDNVDNFYLLHTDNYFLREIICAVKQHAITSTFPVYLYRMSVETGLNIMKKIGEIKAPGAAHGDDIGYLFKTKLSPHLIPGSLEEISVRRSVKYWTNFAKYGNPNSRDQTDGVQWQPVKKGELHFLDIGEELMTGVNPELERMKFWDEIFSIHPDYN